MALTYDQSSNLMTDGVFRGRIQVACLKYADTIRLEDPTTSGHSPKLRWAQNTFANPSGIAAQMQSSVVMDPNVQDQGSAIPDAGLQSAVEATVEKFL